MKNILCIIAIALFLSGCAEPIYNTTEYSNGITSYRNNYGEDDTVMWKKNGVTHKIDAPAITKRHGKDEMWYENGEPHRVGGPAIIHDKGSHWEYCQWWHRGVKHNANGAAETLGCGTKDGVCKYFLNGIEYSFEEYKIKTGYNKDF